MHDYDKICFHTEAASAEKLLENAKNNYETFEAAEDYYVLSDLTNWQIFTAMKELQKVRHDNRKYISHFKYAIQKTQIV